MWWYPKKLYNMDLTWWSCTSSNNIGDMIQDIGEDNFRWAHMYDSLKDDSKKALYPGCTSFTRLSMILILFNNKARNGRTKVHSCMWFL